MKERITPTQLPLELFEHILQFIEPLKLPRLMLVNKTWKSTVEHLIIHNDFFCALSEEYIQQAISKTSLYITEKVIEHTARQSVYYKENPELNNGNMFYREFKKNKASVKQFTRIQNLLQSHPEKAFFLAGKSCSFFTKKNLFHDNESSLGTAISKKSYSFIVNMQPRILYNMFKLFLLSLIFLAILTLGSLSLSCLNQNKNKAFVPIDNAQLLFEFGRRLLKEPAIWMGVGLSLMVAYTWGCLSAYDEYPNHLRNQYYDLLKENLNEKDVLENPYFETIPLNRGIIERSESMDRY